MSLRKTSPPTSGSEPVRPSSNVTTAPGDATRSIEFNYESIGTAVTHSDYTLVYTVYDVPNPTPTVTPVVSFVQIPFGPATIFLPQQLPLPGVPFLTDLQYAPNGQDYYGASVATNQITLDSGIAISDFDSRSAFTMPTTTCERRHPDWPQPRRQTGLLDQHQVRRPHRRRCRCGGLGGRWGTRSRCIPAGLTDARVGRSSAPTVPVRLRHPNSLAEDSVFVYDRDATTGTLTLGQVLTDNVGGVEGLAGARSLAVRPGRYPGVRRRVRRQCHHGLLRA